MMFQSMMEAKINDCIENEPLLGEIKAQIAKNKRDDNFRNKWVSSLSLLKQDVSEFLVYFETIYKKYRNPLVHPNKIGLTAFNELSFEALLNGYKNGWEAGVKLHKGLENHPIPDSWNSMCNIYKIPLSVENAT